MKVHIVCKNLDADRVLPRLAKMLADGTGWSLSEKPNQRADINYFFPYLNYAKTKGKTAAWFTHYDENTAKAQRWDDAAANVDLRITSAPIYMPILQPYGAAEYIPLPVEDRFFKVMTTFNPEHPTVGVSGFVYGDGRKGEDLVERLMEDRFCKPCVWKASGQGWAIPDTRLYEWQQMPGFYASLDILVVPSRVEGGPLPPFEALACGVKLVIPRGVGAMDELPAVAGIYHYDAGNYDSLHAALDKAISDGRVNQDLLRDIALRYNPARWVKYHKKVIEGYFVDHQDHYISVADLPEGCGVYYVAFGAPARNCALTAINSWKQHMPEVPVALVSDSPLDAGEDVFIEQVDADLGGRIAKLNINNLAPAEWQYVLYLDADTEIIGDVSFLFQALIDGWDFVICKDAERYASTKFMLRPDNEDEVEATYQLMGYHDLLQLNGGVFAFQRNESTQAFFDEWINQWQQWGKRDQGALLRALHLQPLRLYVVGNEWNTVTRYMNADQSAGILHHPMTARRWEGIIPHRLDSPEAFERITR